MTLTVDDLRQHVTSELEDEALERVLEAAYEAIDDYAGAEGSIRELLTAGPGDLLMLSRSAESVTSVSEGRSTPTVLATNDYELIGNQLLRRLRDGTHPASGWVSRPVDVVYVPMADMMTRDRVAIDLVKLETTFAPGLASQRLGEWAESYAASDAADYRAQRAGILASLFAGFVAV